LKGKAKESLQRENIGICSKLNLPMIELPPLLSTGSSDKKLINEVERSFEEFKSSNDSGIRKVDILALILEELKIDEASLPQEP
jgi:hypothetical protein